MNIHEKTALFYNDSCRKVYVTQRSNITFKVLNSCPPQFMCLWTSLHIHYDT